MEEFLPILIGIAWFIWKMYQGAQKKAQKNQRPAPRPKAKPAYEYEKEVSPQVESVEEDVSLEDFVANFFGDNVSLKPEQEHSQQMDYESVEQGYQSVEDFSQMHTSSIEEGYEINEAPVHHVSVEKGEESLHDKIARMRAMYAQEEEVEEDSEFINFDMRKAIIYNAILNRPYV